MSRNTAEKQYITNIAIFCAFSLSVAGDQLPFSSAAIIFSYATVVLLLVITVYSFVIMPPMRGSEYSRARLKAEMRATQRAHAPDMQVSYSFAIVSLMMLNFICNHVDLNAKQVIAIALSLTTTIALFAALVRSFQLKRRRMPLVGQSKKAGVKFNQ